MGNCKDCKWWEADAGRDPLGYCHLLSTRSERDRPYFNALAELRGYDDSELHTAPDFGCVLFEAKQISD